MTGTVRVKLLPDSIAFTVTQWVDSVMLGGSSLLPFSFDKIQLAIDSWMQHKGMEL